MLLNFRMSNHRSVREEQELQLHPAYDADRPAGTDWAAVPVAGLFGANAAGKSNLVGALGYEESAGTKALLEQAPRFLSVLRRGGTLIVDEIDSSLHPLLTTQLIKLFQEPDTNPRGAQLVFTSHDASLLGRVDGEDILKRDQVWFVEKDQYGETRLFALSEFKPRPGENHERRYLGGSYGGVPFIDECLAKALATRGERNGTAT